MKFTIPYWWLQKQSPDVFCKKGVPTNFANFTWKYLCWSLFLIKLQVSGLQLYLKETPIHVFSCEFWKNVKNTYFEEQLRMTVSLTLLLILSRCILLSLLTSNVSLYLPDAYLSSFSFIFSQKKCFYFYGKLVTCYL